MIKAIPKIIQGKNHLPSVNLSLDSKEPLEILQNFYLSKKGSDVVSIILDSVLSDKRKRIGTLTAPPGSGKSYLALFIGTLLSNSMDWDRELNQIIERQNKTHFDKFSDSLKTFRYSKERFLPVYIIGESSSLKTSIIENIFLALEPYIIDRYIEILYDHFKDELQFNRKSGESKKLINRITNEIKDKDSFFIIYRSTLRLLKKFNFVGYALFHDEFNRFLNSPSGINNIDLDFLQDFAEYNLRLREMKVVHYLLMHKGISQYLTGVSEEKRKDWLKIEGRFYSIFFQEELSDVYGLISNFLYENNSFIEGKRKTDIIQLEIKKAYQLNPILKEEVGHELSEISLKAYPLHITTLISMPLLSSLLGQNERTIYTYLSSITGEKIIGFLRIDALYDYFDTSIDKLGLEDTLLSKWQYGRNALDEITGKIERNLIKILTVLTVINKQTLLPCSADWIDFCIGYEYQQKRDNKEIERILKNLVNKNYAIYRESTETYQIYYGSSIHLHSKVEEKAKTLSKSDLQNSLEKSFSLRPIYANAYNAEYFTSRFYTRKFIFESTFMDSIQFFIEENEKVIRKESPTNDQIYFGLQKFLTNLIEVESKSGSAGVFIYYLGNQDSNICKILIKIIREEFIGKSFILISSKKSFYELDLFRRYEAVQLLRDDSELNSVDQRVSEDIKIYLSDLSEKIEQLLKSHFQLSSSRIDSHNSYQITSFDSLGELISQVIKIRFPHCPKINCEFIVRESLSPVIRNTRKKLIRALLTSDKSHATKDNGYGPDVAIFRSLFVTKNLLLENHTSLQFSFNNPKDFKGNPDIGMKKIYEEIVKYLESQPKNLIGLYKILISEPYGIYSELIPLYLLAILIERRYAFSLYEDGRYEKEITSDVWERVHLYPGNFRIQIVKTTDLMDSYLDSIVEIFNNSRLTPVEETYGSREKNKFSENKIYRSIYLLLKWYTRLPEYTRKTSNLSREATQFLSFIMNSSDPEVIILKQIPSILKISLTTSTNEDLDKALHKLRGIRFEVESTYSKLIFEISKSCKKVISPFILSPNPTLKEDIIALLEKKSISINNLKNQDPSFKKLYDRLSLTYSTEESLIESIASLLSDSHPRSWRDESLMQFEFKFASELAKITLATQLNMTVDSKIEKIIDEFRSLEERERKMLLDRLMKFTRE